MPETAEPGKCPFEKLCEDSHPEEAMAKKRAGCTFDNCKKCGVYWAFRDGYNELYEE